MTAEQLETAARRLCELRKLNQDDEVEMAFARAEIERFSSIQAAINYALLEGQL